MAARKRSLQSEMDTSVSDQTGSSQKLNKEQRVWNSMSIDERKRKVQDMVRYLLFASSERQIVKRKDILDAVIQDRSAVFNRIFDEANKELQSVFGLEAIETTKGSQKVYIIVNQLQPDTRDAIVSWSEEEQCQYGLLSVILSVIMMRPEGTIKDDILWKTLKRLGFCLESASHSHPTFGVPKDAIGRFIEQGYLENNKKAVGEVQIHEYSWGQRAHQEVDKKQLLSLIAEIHEDDASRWERQFADLVDSDSSS